MQDYIYIRERKRKPHVKIFTVLVFLLIFFFVSQKLFIKNNPSSIISPLADSVPAILSAFKNSSLKDPVEQALKGTSATYGIAVKNLKSNETYFLNENEIFEAASLYKLWVMAVVYKQIAEGTLKKDKVLTQNISVLNKKFGIASGSAEKKEGEIGLSVYDALERMITVSDNYSALLLSEKVKLSKVALFLKENGFNDSNVGTDGKNPRTTPYDIALFFEKLYKGQLAGSKETEEMIDLLKKQRLNDKLPKNLPDNIILAHKTGELGYFTHDAGIVYTKKGDYIIVVLSKSTNPKGAEKRIADISKNVYDYFQSL